MTPSRALEYEFTCQHVAQLEVVGLTLSQGILDVAVAAVSFLGGLEDGLFLAHRPTNPEGDILLTVRLAIL